MPTDFMTVNPAAARNLASKSALPLVARYTEQVAGYARILAPGSMKDHIRPVTLPGAVPRGIVVCDHPAASFVLRGTKPHDIKPKKGKYLVFTPKGSSKKIFYPHTVHHPGTKANNFLLHALELVR